MAAASLKGTLYLVCQRLEKIRQDRVRSCLHIRLDLNVYFSLRFRETDRAQKNAFWSCSA